MNSTEARKEMGAFILGNHAPGGKQSFAPSSTPAGDDRAGVRCPLNGGASE